nr:MAG TPA: hypothetical protein [Caudoviricetes sp.]
MRCWFLFVFCIALNSFRRIESYNFMNLFECYMKTT